MFTTTQGQGKAGVVSTGLGAAPLSASPKTSLNAVVEKQREAQSHPKVEVKKKSQLTQQVEELFILTSGETSELEREAIPGYGLDFSVSTPLVTAIASGVQLGVIDGQETKNEVKQAPAAESKEDKIEEKQKLVENKFFKPTEKIYTDVLRSDSFIEQEPMADSTGIAIDEGGFEIFGVTRADGVKALLQYAIDESKEEAAMIEKSKKIRRIAAPEIRKAFLEDELPEIMRDDRYQQLKKQYTEGKLNLEKKLKVLNTSEFKDEAKLSLCELMFHLHTTNKKDQYNQLLSAARGQVSGERAVDEYCESSDVFKAYLTSYYGKQQKQLKLLHFSEVPVTSMIDAFAQHLQCDLCVYREEENKTEVKRTTAKKMMPIHYFIPNGGAKRAPLYVLYVFSHAVGRSLLDSKRYNLLIRARACKIKTKEELVETSVVIHQPQSIELKRQESTYIVKLDDINDIDTHLTPIYKKTWRERNFHEALHAILEAREKPMYINRLRIILGPNVIIQKALIDRDTRHLIFDDIRKLNEYHFYLFILDMAHKKLMKLYQPRVFDAYKHYLDKKNVEEVSPLKDKLELLNKKLRQLQRKILAVPLYKERQGEIDGLEKSMAEAAGLGEPGKDAVKSYKDMIRIRRQAQLEANPYREKEKALIISIKSVNDDLEECSKKWDQESKLLQEVETCLAINVEDYCLEYQDGQWLPSSKYKGGLEQYIYSRDLIAASKISEVKTTLVAGIANVSPSSLLTRTDILSEGKKVENKASPQSRAVIRKLAQEKAKLYLEKFSDYERQLLINPYGITIADAKEFKQEIIDKSEKQIIQIILAGMEDMAKKIGVIDKAKLALGDCKEHFQYRLEVVKKQYFFSSSWKKLNSTCDLMEWIDVLRIQIEILDRKIIVDEVYDKGEAIEGPETLIENYKQNVRLWWAPHESTMKDRYHGKTTQQVQNIVIDEGIAIGKMIQAELADPTTGNTLLHWVSSLFQLFQEDTTYQNRLIEIMIILFHSGSAIQVRNLQGKEACSLDQLKFSVSGWKAMAALLYTSRTVSELVEHLRTELYCYTSKNTLMLVDDESDTVSTQLKKGLTRKITQLDANKDRIVETGKLIRAMTEATTLMDDEIVLRALGGIINDEALPAGYFTHSWWLMNSPDVINPSALKRIALESYKKYKRNEIVCFGVLSRVESQASLKFDSERENAILKAELKEKDEEIARVTEESKKNKEGREVAEVKAKQIEKEKQQAEDKAKKIEKEKQQAEAKAKQAEEANRQMTLELQQLRASSKASTPIMIHSPAGVSDAKATLFSPKMSTSLPPSASLQREKQSPI